MAACTFGDLLLATTLIRHSADVRATSDEGATALHLAACSGKDRIVSLLVHYGPELEVMNSQYHTTLHRAVLDTLGSSGTVQ